MFFLSSAMQRMSVKDVKFQTGMKDIQIPYFVPVNVENNEEVIIKTFAGENTFSFLALNYDVS